MSLDRVLLVEIGTPAELPVVTPPSPRPPASWTPDPRPSPGLPPPTGLAVESIADAAVLTWTRSTAPGAQTVVESAPDSGGAPGIWREAGRTGSDSYTLSLPAGPRWVRVRAELNGRTSVATNAVLAEPVDLSGSITDLERELRDIAEQVAIVAAQAAADAAALSQRADDLRDDLDTTIAQVSTLGEVTETLGTELTRVETQSIERDTATTATLALLGAKNAAGTAFVLDDTKLQVSPGESLAQWRSSLQGQFQGQSSRIDSEEQARQDADQALASTLATVQATANNAATKAELTSAQNALAAADQAEANARNTLAVQMRGSYTGTNPGQLTQGLIYSERQARITAEGVLASSVNAMQIDLAGKASVSDLAATQLTVQQQGQTLSSHGQQLNGLTASVGTVEAGVREAREVAVSAVSGNALANPSFETDDGWRFTTEFVQYFETASAATGQRVLRLNPGGGNAAALNLQPVWTGQKVRLGGLVRPVGAIPNSGARLRLQLNRYSSDGTYVSTALVGYVPRPSSYIWTPFEFVVTVPEGVGFVAFIVGSDGLTSGALAVDDVYLEPESNALARAMASYVMAVQAGGRIAGLKMVASDDISVIDFVSDMIRFSPQSGNNGWSYDGAKGQQITRGGNYMKVEGAPFGAGNNFLFWMGPYLSSIAQCSTNNALFAFLTNGNMFINGAIVNGVIEKTTSTSELGPVPTLGGDIFVDGSLRGTALFSQPASNGALQVQGSQSYTVSLQRRIGSGSWVTVATAQGSASWGTPMYLDTVPPTWQVSASGGIPTIEYVDTDPSLQDRSFRLVKGSVSGSLQWRSGPSGAWSTYSPPNNYRIRSSEVAG